MPPIPSPPPQTSGRGAEVPTSEHDTAKDSVVPLQRGAVPSVVAELVLTLSDPLARTLAH